MCQFWKKYDIRKRSIEQWTITWKRRAEIHCNELPPFIVIGDHVKIRISNPTFPYRMNKHFKIILLSNFAPEIRCGLSMIVLVLMRSWESNGLKTYFSPTAGTNVLTPHPWRHGSHETLGLLGHRKVFMSWHCLHIRHIFSSRWTGLYLDLSTRHSTNSVPISSQKVP